MVTPPSSSHPPHRPQPSAPHRNRLQLYLDLIRFNRPAGWLLLLWPTLSALWIAAGGFPGWHLVAVFTLGTILMRSAGCCINDVADRDFDRHVKRTAGRPVTSGALSVRDALTAGAALALAAFALVLTTNALTIALSVPALAVAILYPFSKRYIAMPQAVLGIAFSMGIPMAFAAVQGQVPLWSLWLVLGNLFWVLAYDTEYAMVDRDDDLRIGIRTSAITLGRWDVTAVMVFYLFHGLIWALSLIYKEFNAIIFISFPIMGLQIVWHWRLIRTRTREGCFAAFRANHWIGLTLFAGIAITGMTGL